MGDDIPAPTIRTRRVEVTCVPGDHHFSVFVDFMGHRDGVDWYSVTDGFSIPDVLGKNHKWTHRHKPFSHSPSWRKSHEFPLDEAIELAKAYTPHHTVNGFTVADGIRMAAERREQR